MVINEKALVARVKEAYKDGGYTVAVTGETMMITNGYWLAAMDAGNVPNELLALLAGHIRDVPKEGDAYRVTKTKEGAFAQRRILEEATGALKNMLKTVAEELAPGAIDAMLPTSLSLGGMQLWQERPGNRIYMIDPRYAVMFKPSNEIQRLGNGIYAEGEISQLWVLRVDEGDAAKKLRHLELVAWVK